jgi:hypothetical protein
MFNIFDTLPIPFWLRNCLGSSYAQGEIPGDDLVWNDQPR